MENNNIGIDIIPKDQITVLLIIMVDYRKYNVQWVMTYLMFNIKKSTPKTEETDLMQKTKWIVSSLSMFYIDCKCCNVMWSNNENTRYLKS